MPLTNPSTGTGSPGPATSGADYIVQTSGSNTIAKASNPAYSDVAANADFSAVINSCITNMSGFGTIQVQSGTYTASSAISVPRNNSADARWLRIIGVGTPKISLNGIAQLQKFNKVATNDVFQNFEIGGFVIDGTSRLTGSRNAIFGTNAAGVAFLSDIDLINLWYHDLYFVNCPGDQGGSANGTSNLHGVWLAISSTSTHYLDNITVERVYTPVSGLNTIVFVGGQGNSTSSKVMIRNQVRVSDVYHDTGWDTTSFSASLPGNVSNIQVGGINGGEKGSILVERCICKNSGDDGIEINGAAKITIRDCSLENMVNEAYYIGNFAYLNGVDNSLQGQQRASIERCKYTKSSKMGVSASSCFTQIFCNGSPVNIGEINYIDCNSVVKSGAFEGCDGSTLRVTQGGIKMPFAPNPTQTTLASNGGSITNAATTINVTSTSGWAAGDTVMVDNEQIKIGTVASSTQITGCTRAQNGTTAAAHNDGVQIFRVGVAVVSRVVIDNWSHTIEDPFNGGGTIGSNTGEYYPIFSNLVGPNTLVMRDIALVVRGNQTTSTGGLSWRGMLLQGTDLTLSIDGWTEDHQITNSGNLTIYPMRIAASQNVVGGTNARIRGVIRNFKQIAQSGTTNPKGINIGDTTKLSIVSPLPSQTAATLNFENCDFSNSPSGVGGNELYYADGGNAGDNKVNVQHHAIIYKTKPAPVTMSGFVSGTGKAWDGGYIGTAIFTQGSGAGITAIDVSHNAGTTYTNVLTQSSGAMPAGACLSVPVKCGSLLKITFATTAPTVTVVPLDTA